MAVDCHRLVAMILGREDDMTDRYSEGPDILNKEPLRTLFDSVMTAEQRQRFADDSKMTVFSQDERLQMAVMLMLQNNKVTHIYELLKAGGSDTQVRFDRRLSIWRRKEGIAAKHDDEGCVDLHSGKIVRGEIHAPLLYRQSPREDSPEDIGRAIETLGKNADSQIIRAWVTAAL